MRRWLSPDASLGLLGHREEQPADHDGDAAPDENLAPRSHDKEQAGKRRDERDGTHHQDKPQTHIKLPGNRLRASIVGSDIDATRHEVPVHSHERSRGKTHHQRAQAARHVLQRGALNGGDSRPKRRERPGRTARERTQATRPHMIVIGVEVAHERMGTSERDVPDMRDRQTPQRTGRPREQEVERVRVEHGAHIAAGRKKLDASPEQHRHARNAEYRKRRASRNEKRPAPHVRVVACQFLWQELFFLIAAE